MKINAFLIAIVTAVLSTSASAEQQSGFDLESFQDGDRNRPIMIDWWYPVEYGPAVDFNYGLGRGMVVPQGPIADGVFPLLLLSHGAWGAARNYSWLAEHLAKHGFVVAGVSHFGESYLYGEETIDPAEVLKSWHRPLDISAALTYIRHTSRYRHSVDSSKVAVIGHSSGGATAMYLAGAVFDPARMAAYCQSPDSQGDRGCDYAEDNPMAASSKPNRRSFADPRIDSFVALDPALGPGFTDFSGIANDSAVLIVASAQNDFLPFHQHAGRLIARLPQASSHILDQGEGHFVYLNVCDNDIMANGVPLCADRPAVSRMTIQTGLSNLITGFLQQTLAD